jgi:TatD DNase family protein
MPELIDTHAHLDFDNYHGDFADVIKRANDFGVTRIINIASTPDSNKSVIELLKSNKNFYAALGIHPHDSRLATDAHYSFIRTHAVNEKRVVAIGEIGLDFHYNHSSPEIQKSVFRSFIRLAKEVKLPVIIHDREAHEESFSILQEEGAKDTGGIFHCFSGDYDFAKKILDFGFYISITGVVTFKKSHILHDVVRKCPLDRLLVETDSPFLTPEPYRGKRNEPAYVKYVAEKIAELKSMSFDKVAEQTTKNAVALFGLA